MPGKWSPERRRRFMKTLTAKRAKSGDTSTITLPLPTPSLATKTINDLLNEAQSTINQIKFQMGLR